MAYTLQAIVAVADEIQSQLPPPLRFISLCSDVTLVPLGSEASRHLGIPFLPLTDEGKTEVPSRVMQLCERLSQGRTLAYIEAEFFGGAGAQACVVFTDGSQVGQPLVSEKAINQALQILGVSKGSAFDEFEAVGLGAHRDTDAWLEHP
jgi:hypothetical protein